MTKAPIKTLSKDLSIEEKGNWYIALYQFDAVETNDLPLKAGDRINVIENNDEWWKGICNGKTGIFPANYVQKVAPFNSSNFIKKILVLDGEHNIGRAVAAFEATASNQVSLKLGDFVRIHTTSPGGWWEGEVESSEGVKHIGWFPGNYIQVLFYKEKKYCLFSFWIIQKNH